MPYGQPILQIYTSDPTASDNRAVPFIITDDNRTALSLTYDRIEQSARMADGTMRRFITANKRKISTSWENIPAAGGINYTSDGYLSGAFLKSFFEENVYNPIWIKLTYSEEAWRSASNTTPTNRYGYINSTYEKTISNTALPKEVIIEDVGAGRISASTGPAYVVTKTNHGITPGDEIYIKGLADPFNGTWTTSTNTFSSVMAGAYDTMLVRSNPIVYLKLESTTITDSGPASATLNSASRIVSAAGTSSATGFFGNTVVSSGTAYTEISGSISSLPELAFPTNFSVEFWHKGSSDPALSGIDIIRKLPSNLIANYGFNTNTDDWTTTYLVAYGGARLTRDTSYKYSGLGSAKITQDSGSVSYISLSCGDYGASQAIPVTIGQTYTLSGIIRWTPHQSSSPTMPFTALIQWQNSSGTILSTSSGTTTSVASGGWYRISASGVAPNSAATAKVSFVKGAALCKNFYLDSVLFEKSSTVKDYTGWAIQRYSNNKIKFEVYPYAGTGAKIIVPNMYDDEWHHVVFKGTVSSGDLRINAYIDGAPFGSASGTMDNFEGFSAPHDYYLEPIRINHDISSGYRDNIAIFNKIEPNNGINERYKRGKYFPTIPESRALVFYYNADGNSVGKFGINSYIYNDNIFTFNTDSTQLLNVDDTFRLANFKPATGSISFSQIRFIITEIDENNDTTFSASPYWTNGASPTISGSGHGYDGYAVLLSSYPMIKSLAPTAQPVVGTAVASDIIKVFITSFDYNINKRFRLTDYVDVSMEFTEI